MLHGNALTPPVTTTATEGVELQNKLEITLSVGSYRNSFKYNCCKCAGSKKPL